MNIENKQERFQVKATTHLSQQAWKKLSNILENPPKPSEGMKSLMRKPRLSESGKML
ncbi:DUF1778 domain-containing protein [Vibrio sp. D431a]|uniref:type II toxin -antitoxin system TacA 1-like antitoxin n=1 Tax=Vibrio sp. D431a TaxID=2837388 RepID=UPI002555D7CE|nr:DUF1778 domain-containing protein [Vibrio sp. D431a]MDK9793298.1 DUF1778 domain-containing protein [Vibrio sp. D431a]